MFLSLFCSLADALHASLHLGYIHTPINIVYKHTSFISPFLPLHYPLSFASRAFNVFSSVMSTSRGFEPDCDPTMPAASSWSISRPALL